MDMITNDAIDTVKKQSAHMANKKWQLHTMMRENPHNKINKYILNALNLWKKS